MKKAIFKLTLRKNRKNIDGSNSIYIYFKERGSKREQLLSTHFKCNFNDWSQKDQEYRATVKDSYTLNKSLNALKKSCNAIIENFYTDNKQLTFDKFKKELEFKDQPCNNVIDYIDTVIERKKGTIQPQSIKSYSQLKNKLGLMYPGEELYFYDIDYNFLLRFDKYLREHNNNNNTVCRKHKTLQVIINHALKDNLLKSDPYRQFSKGTIKGERIPLNDLELKKLYEVYKKGILTAPQQKALKLFLFMCLTGLRISDLLNLKHKDITLDTDGSGTVSQIININQIKTSTRAKIPLIQKALDLLRTDEADQVDPSDYVFTEYRNGQNINYRLKDVAKAAGIDKNLTNHIARHTFATYCLNKGIDLNTVSKLLGHTDIKTTQIYAKLNDQYKIKEMQKINGMFD